MKKTAITATVFGVMLLGGMSEIYGIGDFPAKDARMITQVTFDEAERGDLLSIKDMKGKTLYSEMIETDGSFSKGFDMSDLPIAQYQIELNKAEEITVLPFKVEKEFVALNNELKTNIAKPTLFTDGDRVILSRETESAQDVKVKIYYQGLELVYSENLEKDGKLRREYDFSGSLNGDYLFLISYDNRDFAEYVYIQ